MTDFIVDAPDRATPRHELDRQKRHSRRGKWATIKGTLAALIVLLACLLILMILVMLGVPDFGGIHFRWNERTVPART